MNKTPRQIVEDVLSRDMARRVWSGNYEKVLPVAILDFEVSAVLPAVFYMFRYGHRRGTGNFLKTYGSRTGTMSQRRRSATIERIAEILAKTDGMTGFIGQTQKAILGDLLLCYCLENVRHHLGRNRQVQRVFPAHYMANWVDLPQSVAHIRHVPEMIVAMLANQKGEYVESTGNAKTWFTVGKGYESNVLLRAFNQGVKHHGELRDFASDRFDETDSSVGLDQLLMIRLAQNLKAAPDKTRTKAGSRISNQHPIAERAARDFSDDLRRFLRRYSSLVPRQALVDMLESCIAVGITTILTSTIHILVKWEDTGEVVHKKEQRPEALFVDCSNGIDRTLMSRAEQSMDDAMRQMEQLPSILMILRLLDYHASNNVKTKNLSVRPYATQWINLLGDLLYDRHRESSGIHYILQYNAHVLSARLLDDYPEAARILANDDVQPNPVKRLAHGLTALMGSKQIRHFREVVDSSLLAGRPNGLATKRKTTRGGGMKRRRRDVRSLVFSDAVLDYLVHLHVLPSGNKVGIRRLSFGEFLDTLRNRYGFHVDRAPHGMDISNEVLQSNRAMLERRLRDLGLLSGVNDAEAMKRLRPRYVPAEEM